MSRTRATLGEPLVAGSMHRFMPGAWRSRIVFRALARRSCMERASNLRRIRMKAASKPHQRCIELICAAAIEAGTLADAQRAAM
ncbi:hypothetical protein [Paraburkholderia sp. J76]|uniref:hypothetical protein n=1 Tax=Paraburkholderia sp. J76 TaxID=2805439 RepID=UPI002ABE969D|nr:hypothetical protein [Paraburkholderia sp. J76]